MKKSLMIAVLLTFGCWANAQLKDAPDKDQPVEVLKATCGSCQWGMKSKDCALAVKYNGKNYFVTGTDIDDHGNAHAKNGFCNAVRKAEVQGTVVDDKFVVTYFKLLSDK